MALVNVEHVSRVYRQDSIAVKALDDALVLIRCSTPLHGSCNLLVPILVEIL